jgi:hypothetical protein
MAGERALKLSLRDPEVNLAGIVGLPSRKYYVKRRVCSFKRKQAGRPFMSRETYLVATPNHKALSGMLTREGLVGAVAHARISDDMYTHIHRSHS